MKNYYAKSAKQKKCYAFRIKGGRDIAVKFAGLISLTRSEAMKQFGYTDSRSIRVIECTKVTPEIMAQLVKEIPQ